MSKLKFGKWDVTGMPLNGKNAGWYLAGSPERAICFIRSRSETRLLVAAPEMYDLLKYFVSGKFTAEDVGSKYHWACEAGRKLLARIDGEDDEE